VKYYNYNQDELKYKVEGNNFLELQKYDRPFFGLNRPQLFLRNLIKILKKKLRIQF
jgi:hypothetical protein